MKRFFRLALSGLAMLAVALISALISMRLALHGSEVEVPNLANLTIPEANELMQPKGLQLTLENRFYSLDTPAGRILSQSPPAGTHVRRGWQVRISESLGAQKVDIPNVVGQDERSATVNIRRLSLDLGTVAYLPSPGQPDVVLAQTPPPNAEGVDRPRVSLLLSQPPGTASVDAVVAPTLTGLTLSIATVRAAANGLHIAYAAATPAPQSAATAPAQTPATNQQMTSTVPAQTTPTTAPAVTYGGYVVAQTPPAGHRILRGESIHVILGGTDAVSTN